MLLVGCGDSDDGTSAPPADSDGADSDGADLLIGARRDLTFDKDGYEAEAGEIEILYRNEGSVSHTLLVRGVDDFKLSVGFEDRGSLTLDAGTYELYCDVSGHEAAGMVAELTVS